MSKKMKIIGVIIGMTILALLIVIMQMTKKNEKDGKGWSVKTESVQSVSSDSQEENATPSVTPTVAASTGQEEAKTGITQTDTGKQKSDTKSTSTSTSSSSAITDNKNIELETQDPVTTEEDLKRYEEEAKERYAKEKTAQDAIDAEEAKKADEEAAKREKEDEEAAKQAMMNDPDDPRDENGDPVGNIQYALDEEDVHSSSEG